MTKRNKNFSLHSSLFLIHFTNSLQMRVLMIGDVTTSAINISEDGVREHSTLNLFFFPGIFVECRVLFL